VGGGLQHGHGSTTGGASLTPRPSSITCVSSKRGQLGTRRASRERRLRDDATWGCRRIWTTLPAFFDSVEVNSCIAPFSSQHLGRGCLPRRIVLSDRLLMLFSIAKNFRPVLGWRRPPWSSWFGSASTAPLRALPLVDLLVAAVTSSNPRYRPIRKTMGRPSGPAPTKTTSRTYKAKKKGRHGSRLRIQAVQSTAQGGSAKNKGADARQ
jgi:hypothetical protein